MSTLTLSSVVQQATQIVSSHVDDDVVMLNMARNRYYGAGVVGSRIWVLLAAPHTVARLVDVLLDEFDVPRDLCEAEVLAFLGRLHDEGLVTVRDAG